MEERMNNIINALTNKEVLNLEAKLRRKLNHQGYVLRKGKDVYRLSGYMIVDSYNNFVAAGASPNAFSLSLAEVLKFTES